MRVVKIVTAIFLVFIAGCQTILTGSSNPGNITYSGKSHAGSTLRVDTTKMISLIASGKGCDDIEHINIEVLQYEPSNGVKGHEWGKEGWIATGCDKPFPFLVSFTEDGSGGTFFGLKLVQR